MISGTGMTRDSCNVDEAMMRGQSLSGEIEDSIFYIIDAYVDEI
jgi:hypothetical protein